MSIVSRLKRVQEVFLRHLYFVGPGLVSAVAYVDPGNWATDLQAGASYGYKLLFVILVAGIAGVVLQLLSVRLGAVTSTSLPVQTRLLFLRWQDKYPRYRLPLKLGLWALYGLAEIAIIGTDLAELIGSAIALNLLFPRLPLFAGVLVTASDVLIVLLFFRSSTGRQGMMMFEIIIVTLVLAVFVSFMILLHLIKPEWQEVFFGLVPSHTLVQPGALYVGVGIIGATVMPHALFLGSSLASVDRLNMLPVPPSTVPARVDQRLPSLFSRARHRRNRAHERTSPSPSVQIELTDFPTRGSTTRLSRTDLGVGFHDHAESSRAAARREGSGSSLTERHAVGLGYAGEVDGMEVDLEGKVGVRRGSKSSEEEAAQRVYEAEVRAFDRIKWVDVHLFHATIDTGYSLLGFALTINSAILTLAGAAFYYNKDADPNNADLFGAYDLIKSFIGNGAAIIFALALLCAGQSASITATLAGQIVSEGFIEWKTSPFARRLITRLIGVVPAAIISASVGASGLNTMLVASQVLLSLVLPTVILPLVYLCSRTEVMTVLGPEIESIDGLNEEGEQIGSRVGGAEGGAGIRVGETGAVVDESGTAPIGPGSEDRLESASIGRIASISTTTPTATRLRKSYVSPRWVSALGYLLFGIIIVANVYVIVELGLGAG